MSEKQSIILDHLALDVYSPPDPRGAVVLVAGYPDEGFAKFFGYSFKDMPSNVAWAQRIAAAGMAAIVYANREPAADVLTVIRYARERFGEVGLWASSGNVPVALSALSEVRCAALLYGYLLDLDGHTAVADAARTFRFSHPPVSDVPDIPLFLVRAGRDEFPGINDTFDRFVARALRRNLPITAINHAGAPHAFDLSDESAATREIIRQTVEFLRAQLSS